MLRAILAVIVGYAVLAVIVAVGLIIAFAVMGPDGAFEEGSYAVTTAWLVVSFALGLAAAIVGGLLCALVAARGSRAPIALAAIILIWGIPAAAYQAFLAERSEPPAREAEVEGIVAMNELRMPLISYWLNPIIGAAGVLIGGRLAGRRGARTIAEPDVGPESHPRE